MGMGTRMRIGMGMHTSTPGEAVIARSRVAATKQSRAARMDCFGTSCLAMTVSQVVAGPLVSATVCRSISASSSAPIRMTVTESQIHVMKPTAAPKEP
jgi:hypothetical protein